MKLAATCWDFDQQSLRVPEGDRDARLEPKRPDPDLNAVRRGFVAGGNSQGDAEIARLRTPGERIHAQHLQMCCWCC
jgi:hypothetical protein